MPILRFQHYEYRLASQVAIKGLISLTRIIMGIKMIIKDVIHIPADTEEEKARLHAKTQTGKSNPFLGIKYLVNF
jgi:hypothetical protein